MKRLVDLTIEDLRATPVWRYELGTGSEGVVVPAGRSSLSQADDEVFLAATSFTFPDSSQHLGYCFPVDDSGIDYLQPVVVTRNGQIRFWFDGPIAQEILSAQWNALGKQAQEIFPVRFHCLVPVDGHTVAGEILQVESSADTSRTVEANGDALQAVGTIRESAQRQAGSAGGTRPNRPRPWAESEIAVVEKRIAPRHNVEMMVDFDQDEMRGNGVTGNVSRAGMFVRAAHLPSTGPLLRLTVHLPGGRQLFLTGKVVRSAPWPLSRSAARSGFGLSLTERPAEYEDFLSRILDPNK